MFKEFFYLQRTDRIALIALLSLVIFAAIVIFGIGGSYTETPLVNEDSVMMKQRCPIAFGHRQENDTYQVGGRYVERFPFDPNTADSEQLLRLGLRPWQVRNVYKFRAAGGVFRTPSDFARLYGLTQKEYKELAPYIQISEDYRPASEMVGERETYVRDTLKYPIKISVGEHIALNTADTLQLKKVPGIGSGWAHAIVNYRSRLGGFYAVSQLEEIEGFPEETEKFFTIDPSVIHKMNVNQLTLSQLRRHPYINFYQARAIMDYRRLNGKLENLNQLCLLKEFPPAAIQRLEPYVEF